VFGGRPPDILLADLCAATDCLPVQHVRRLLGRIWGDDVPLPLIVALFQPRHLDLPDWRAHVDDFLLPPHAPEEILARISLLLFRRRRILAGNTIELPGVTIYLDSGQVCGASGVVVPVTPREFDLLKFLATHRGRLFSRRRLVDLVWGVDFEGGERTVDIHVRRLRAKLPAETAALLETRRSVGYGIGAG
jgi:DNA-binding response OmpR family regulator